MHQIELEMQNDELRRAQAELEAAQARFFELYDLAPVGYCTLSEEGVILEANLTMATLLDVARGDLVAQPLSRFVLPEDQDVWYLRRKAVFATDSVPAFPVRMVRAKRGQFWARIEATVAPDAEGARTCLVSLSDVTEHKQAADDLEASAGYWQETFDALSDAVSLVTPEGQILRCNRAHETLLGKPVAEIVGHTCFELIHKTKSPIAGCPVVLARQTGKREQMELAVGDRLCLVTADPVLDSQGRVTAAVHIVSDITERKRADKALRASQERLALTIESANLGIWDRRFDTGKLTFNERWAAMLGYSFEELQGEEEPWRTRVHPDDRAAVMETLERHLRGESASYESEHRLRTKSGEWIWVSDRGRVVERAADGKPIRFLGTHMDITERKRAAAVSAAMLEISGAEQKGTGLDDFLVAVHAAVGRLMDAKNFYVALHDPAADLLHFPYQIDEEAPPWAPFPPGDGPISRVLRSGKALLATPEGVEGFLRRGEVKPSGPIPRYWLGAPLIVGNTTIGALVVQTYTEGVTYGEWEKNVLAFVSRHVAQAIERKRSEEALRVSEAKYRGLHESLIDGYVMVDVAGHMLEFNEAYRAMLGYAAAELKALTYQDLTPAKWREFEQRIVTEQILPQGFSDVYEKEYRRKDGTVFPVELRTSLLRNPDGAPVAMWGIVRDITSRKRGQERIARLNRLLRTISQVNQLIVRERDRDRLLAEACRILVAAGECRMAWIGFADEASGTVVPAAWAGHEDGYLRSVAIRFDDTPLGRGPTGTAIREGHAAVIDNLETDERFAPWREGARLRGYRSSAAVPIMVGGTIAGALTAYMGETAVFDDEMVGLLGGLSGDIGLALEMRAAEDAHRETQERYRVLFEHSPIGIYRTTPEGRILVANRALIEMLGYATLDELLARNLEESGFEPDYPRGQFKEALERDGEIRGFEAVWLTKDGRRLFVRENAQAFRDADGTVLYYEGAVEDVTAEREALAELERSRAQLLQAQKMEAIGRLAGGVAHDFNNILQALLSLATVLRLRAGSPEVTRTVAEIDSLVKRGGALTQELLLFSRREITKKERLDLGEAAREAGAMLRRLIPANVRLAIEAEAAWVEADRGQIQQVITNLAINARDAMPDGGALTIRVGRADGEAILEVADTGHGMDEEVRAHLFEPFFTTKEKHKGSGLGLSVVHGIVEQHGGRIEVDSAPGRGARFRVIFPMAAPPEGTATEQPEAEDDLPEGRGEWIVLVEDEDDARRGLQAMFEMLGYRVTALASGEEAGSPRGPGARPAADGPDAAGDPGLQARHRAARALAGSQGDPDVRLLRGRSRPARHRGRRDALPAKAVRHDHARPRSALRTREDPPGLSPGACRAMPRARAPVGSPKEQVGVPAVVHDGRPTR